MVHISADTAVSISTIVFLYLTHKVVPSWIADTSELLIKKLFIHSKHSYIIYTHSKRHQLPTADHVPKLAACQDHPCDLLHKGPDDLGLR